MEERRTITIIPTDMAKMHEYQGIPIPTPSLEHTLTDCDQCGRQGWIGPAQRLHMLFNKADVLCYWCIFADMEAGAELGVVKGLDETADDKPRRW